MVALRGLGAGGGGGEADVEGAVSRHPPLFTGRSAVGRCEPWPPRRVRSDPTSTVVSSAAGLEVVQGQRGDGAAVFSALSLSLSSNVAAAVSTGAASGRRGTHIAYHASEVSALAAACPWVCGTGNACVPSSSEATVTAGDSHFTLAFGDASGMITLWRPRNSPQGGGAAASSALVRSGAWGGGGCPFGPACVR